MQATMIYKSPQGARTITMTERSRHNARGRAALSVIIDHYPQTAAEFELLATLEWALRRENGVMLVGTAETGYSNFSKTSSREAMSIRSIGSG